MCVCAPLRLGSRLVGASLGSSRGSGQNRARAESEAPDSFAFLIGHGRRYGLPGNDPRFAGSASSRRMPIGGKRSAVTEAPFRSSLPLHRSRATTAPQSPVKRVPTQAFPTRFQGGDDSLSIVQDFDDVLASGDLSGQAVSESQRRQPGIAKSMKTKAQSKTVSKRRRKETEIDGPARGAKIAASTPAVDEEAVLIAPTVGHQAAVAENRALNPRTSRPASRNGEVQPSLDPTPEQPEVQDQDANQATDLVRPSSPAFAKPLAVLETPVPQDRSSLRRRILAPETPVVDSSRLEGIPLTPTRPRLGLQIDSTGSKKARQSLPEDAAAADIAPRIGPASPTSPLAERLEESRPAVPLPSEQRSGPAIETEDEQDLRQFAHTRGDSPPIASQNSLHCIVYCWHRDSQSSSQMQGGQSFSQSHTQPQAYSASQHSQSQFLTQPQPLSQQSSIIATNDGERGVDFFEGMEEQPWVRIGVDQVVELSRGGGGEERGKTRLYRMVKGPPTRSEVAHYCNWSGDR